MTAVSVQFALLANVYPLDAYVGSHKPLRTTGRPESVQRPVALPARWLEPTLWANATAAGRGGQAKMGTVEAPA